MLPIPANTAGICGQLNNATNKEINKLLLGIDLVGLAQAKDKKALFEKFVKENVNEGGNLFSIVIPTK